MREKCASFIKEIMAISKENALYSFYNYCKSSQADLQRPMRIAITGTIKTGKSTLMNALLGQYIVPTAAEVLTYNVNWFHHASISPSGECVNVHYNDGNSEIFPLDQLDSFVKFSKEKKENLECIHWVDVYLDNPILKEFDLIDTPGLNSLVGDESQHTRDLLTKEENRPDAIIYLIKKGITDTDISDVQSFHDATGLMSGLNTVAALTRVDELRNGFTDAEAIITDNENSYSDVRYFFSRIFPISAILAESSKCLTNKQIEQLLQLADCEDINCYLYTKDLFVYKCPILLECERESLCKVLSISGIRIILSYIKNYPQSSNAELCQYLMDYSRVDDLKAYIINQFGERASFNLVLPIIQSIKHNCELGLKNQKLLGNQRKVLTEVLIKINRFIQSLYDEFASYFIISDFYNGMDYFSLDDWNSALKVLGDKGDDLQARFDIQNSSPTEIVESSYNNSITFWNNRANYYYKLANTKAEMSARKISEILTLQKHEIGI